MPDVGSQLAEYFEAATERIDADDVFAAASVQRQLRAHRAPTRQMRPAWAAAIGFFGVVILVGGVMLSAWLGQPTPPSEPASLGGSVAESGGGWSWWPIALVVGVILAGAFVLARTHRRATKEDEMQSVDEKQREATGAGAPRRSRRTWFIGLVALVVIAGAIAAWAIVEANQKSDIEVATDLVDEWAAAWNAADPEAIVALFTEEAREEELAAAQRFTTEITNVVRTSDLEAREVARTYRYTVQFDWGSSAWTGEYEVELDGELLSRMEAVTSWSVLDPTG